jgi:ubiquinone/menaquinone biosynthesis C-methylase UbiE
MTLPEAEELIKCDELNSPQPQTWFDLGCGSGLFSRALAELLPQESLVCAVDKQTAKFKDRKIKFVQLDFVEDPLPKLAVNGILMANSLHYVNDKLQFLNKVKRHLMADGFFLLVEYDIEVPNYWVPFPVSFASAQGLFKQAGFDTIRKISEMPSVLNNRKIYAALFHHQN